MCASSSDNNRPNVRSKLFWEFDVPKINWNDRYRIIIQRVLERGTKTEWHELVNYYGWDKVMLCSTREILYMPDDIINEAADFFNLKVEDFRCYHRKPFLPGYWI